MDLVECPMVKILAGKVLAPWKRIGNGLVLFVLGGAEHQL